MELKLMLSLEMLIWWAPLKEEGGANPRLGYSDTQYIGFLRQIVIKLGNLVEGDQEREIRNRHRTMGQGVLWSKNNITKIYM